jgi:hypothetical protein
MHNPASVCPSGVQISIHLLRTTPTKQTQVCFHFSFILFTDGFLGSSATTIDAKSRKEGSRQTTEPKRVETTRRFGSYLFSFILFFTNFFIFICLFVYYTVISTHPQPPRLDSDMPKRPFKVVCFLFSLFSSFSFS